MNRRDFSAAAVAATLAPQLAQAAPIPSGFDLRRADARGVAEHGWLSSRHSFSFARYYDPEQLGFSDLMVINEDRVQPGRGFGTHPHRNVEIFTYVLEGSLEHRDSMGNGAVIVPGDVQFMSAGRGVTHSEFNPSAGEGVHFLQIWLAPNEQNTTPGYQQQAFTSAQKGGRLAPILTPDGAHGSMTIKQDARVYAGLFDGPQAAMHKLGRDRLAYVHVARGQVQLNGVVLQAGDGVKVRQPGARLELTQGRGAEVLLFDLRNAG